MLAMNTAPAATGIDGWNAKSRYGTASIACKGLIQRSLAGAGTQRPITTSPASIPAAPATKRMPAEPAAYGTYMASAPTIKPFGSQAATSSGRIAGIVHSARFSRNVVMTLARPVARGGRSRSPKAVVNMAQHARTAEISSAPRGPDAAINPPPTAKPRICVPPTETFKTERPST